MEELNYDQIYKEIQCSNPPYLQGMNLYNINDDRLNCPSNVNITRIMDRESGEYGITTDLKIREIKL